MSLINQTTISETSAPPAEHPVFKVEPYTDCIHILLELNSKDDTLESYISDFLDGCGNVELVEIEVSVFSLVEKQYFRAGIGAVGSRATIDHLCMTKSGIAIGYSQYHTGEKQIITTIPLSNVSRQIRPASSNLPMLRLVYEKSADITVQLSIYLKVNGPRYRYHTIQGPTLVNVTQNAPAKASKGNSS